MDRLTRRAFCAGLGAAALSLAARPAAASAAPQRDGRLRARPGRPRVRADVGIQPLVSGRREGGAGGWLLVPEGYTPERAWPVALFFRGAITPSRRYVDAFVPFANASGLVIVAPEPLGRTWDIVDGGFGPDADVVNDALAEAFAAVRADPARLSASGFSDGGSYALSLGLANGDLFQKVVAFAPGFRVEAARRGRPRVTVIHGTEDQVLPFARTGRRLTEEMRGEGYAVDLRTFAGGHGVEPSFARAAIAWMAGGPPVPERPTR